MKCEICNKIPITGRQYSFKGSQCTKRVLTTQKPNVKRVRVVDEKGRVGRMNVCTKCLRAGAVTRA